MGAFDFDRMNDAITGIEDELRDYQILVPFTYSVGDIEVSFDTVQPDGWCLRVGIRLLTSVPVRHKVEILTNLQLLTEAAADARLSLSEKFQQATLAAEAWTAPPEVP